MAADASGNGRDGTVNGTGGWSGSGEGGRRLRLSAEPVTGPAGTTDAVVVAAVDISGHLDSHGRLRLFLTIACAVLVALSAMAGRWLAGRAVRPALTALDQQEAFFADVAHDLRTPVTSMRLLAETGLRGEADSHEVLRRTLRQSTRMSELVDDLLTRARLMAGAVPLEREPLRLDQLVDAVVADTPTHGHRVTVRAEAVVVLADAGLLRRAVANLLGNALTHGHTPGELDASPNPPVPPSRLPAVPRTAGDEQRACTTGSTGLGRRRTERGIGFMAGCGNTWWPSGSTDLRGVMSLGADDESSRYA